MHSWPAGQDEALSVTVHGETQCPSTQTVPPWQDEAPLPVHGPGLVAHTAPRAKLHWYPAGHDPSDEQWGTQTPLTHA
jgi:hypothetical protein